MKLPAFEKAASRTGWILSSPVFNASISFDKRLYKEDIQGTIAHVTMLAAQGIIDPKKAE